LKEQLPGPLLVWGVVEGGGDRTKEFDAWKRSPSLRVPGPMALKQAFRRSRWRLLDVDPSTF